MKINAFYKANISTDISSKYKPNEDHLKHNNRDNKTKKSTIYAGNLNLNDTTTITNRLAKKNAIKTILDQYKKELKTDQNVEDLRKNQNRISVDLDYAASQVLDLRAKRKELQESYGISDQDKEQTDLALLEKSIFSPDKMTTEDYDQLKNIGSLTDYQQNALKYDTMELIWQGRVQDASNSITNITRTITAIGLEKLKTHPMVDAQKQAAEIIDAAIKEVIGALVLQGKEKIDETAEKNKAEAEKSQKEQEKKDTVENKNSIKDIDNSSSLTSSEMDRLQAASELKRNTDKRNLSKETLKGILVDEQV